MSQTRLVLFEGPVGAGKSTSCANLGERLRALGIPATDWFGFTPDHPIETRCERLARRAFGGETDVEPPPLDPDDERLFTAPQWARFAEALSRGDALALVEGKYLQQCLEYPYLCGATRAQLFAVQDAIVDAMAPAHPRLIYFELSDPAAHRAEVVAERPDAWPAALGGFFALHPWAQRRGLTGADAFHAFYDHWLGLETVLVARHRGPKLIVRDAHLDRAAARERIDAFVGG